MRRYSEVAILGGYGGVGAALAAALVQETDTTVVVVGRDPARLDSQVAALGARARAVHLDVTDTRRIGDALGEIPLWVQASSASDATSGIAAAAIRAGADLLDVGVRRRVVAHADAARDAGVMLVDQCGFHPGLCAPLAHVAAERFDALHRCDIYLAMVPAFHAPASTYDLLELLGEDGRVRQDGAWRSAGWRDTRKWSFGAPFGEHDCFPLAMPEIVDAFEALGVRDGGVYAAGFGPPIDDRIIPLAWLAARIRPGLLRGPLSRALHRAAARITGDQPALVEMGIDAHGLRAGAPARDRAVLTHDDGFALTADPVAALILDLDEREPVPGLRAMGNVVTPRRAVDLVVKRGARLRFDALDHGQSEGAT